MITLLSDIQLQPPAGQQPRPSVESRGVEQPQDGGEAGAGGRHAGAPAPPHPLPLHRLRAVSIISQQVLL